MTGLVAMAMTFVLGGPTAGLADPISVSANFNGTSTLGRWIWFNAHLTTEDPGATGSLYFTNQTVTAGTISFDIPDAVVTFAAGSGTPSTAFDAGSQRWQTTVYLDGPTGDPFMVGLAVQPAMELKALTFTWSGEVTADPSLLGAGFGWQWSAAAYTMFTSDYGALSVKAVDSKYPVGCGVGMFCNSHQSGTPEAYTAYVAGGARGGGASNFTGSNSGTGKFEPTSSPPVPVVTPEPVPVPVPEPGTLVLLGIGMAGAAARLRRRRRA